MSFSRDELLRPSLKGTAIASAPYSVQTTFFAAFFGGPFGAVAIAAINAIRLRRLRRDLPLLALMLAAYIGAMVWLLNTASGAQAIAAMQSFAGSRAVNLLHRAIALAIFGLGYALHAREQRSADVMALDRPNGWIAGLACIFGGIAADVALATLLHR